MDLHRVDLNLLLLFDALYQQRSVGQAAEQLCLSQSACSHALARLRKALDDELFVRVNNTMVPTARAERLAVPVSKALALLRDGFADEERFDPSSSARTFVFAATDYTALTLLPRLMARISQQAPGVKVRVVQTGQKLPMAELETGDIDFALGFTHAAESAAWVASSDWLTDSYTVLARVGHPDIDQVLSLDTYLAQKHILVTPWNEPEGIVDQSLQRLGLKRQVGLQLPDVMVSPFVVAQTDMLVTFPSRMVAMVQSSLPLCSYPPPFELPDYQLRYYWHRLKTGDASYRWMQQLLAQVAAEIV